MNFQSKLSNLLLTLLLTLVSATALAETKWEVATVFFGAREDAEFQADIQKNIKEISSIKTSPNLIVSVARDTPGKKLLPFLKSAFKDKNSKKALILYGHGEGPSGLRDLGTKELKSLLKDLNIKLDVLWFDACFLANLEFLYELRSASQFTIASEEAEFSSGLPFEALSDLPNYSSPEEASSFLAGRFIESYSYLKNGEQRDYVSTSSATISVVNNQELETFVSSFKIVPAIINKLSVENKAQLKNRMKKFSMDEKSLVDTGRLLIELRALVKDAAADQELTKLIRMLNIESVKKLKSNLRVRLLAPEDGALMVFGFNGWENGHKTEYQDNPVFSSILATRSFVPGPRNNQWPMKKFETKSMVFTPFAPGVNTFDYYFLDKTGNVLLSEAMTITRTHDLVESTPAKKMPGAFLTYSAYTQQLGAQAEKYTGVNLTIFDSTPSLDYFELEFNQKINWLSL